MSAEARLLRATPGVSEIVELGPDVEVHLVGRAANGYKALVAKGKRGESTLAAACRKAGIALPKSLPPERPEPPRRRKATVAKLLSGR